MDDPHDLGRFVAAQDPVFDHVCRELRQGRKRTHWMWFVFPQLAGLGHSDMSRRFALRSLAEARAYLAHPVLGPRLEEVTGLVCAVQGCGITQIMGAPDDAKFRSCMTLFVCAGMGRTIYDQALETYFAGVPDPLTLERLAAL